jgi:hypothetical protein
LTSWPYGSRDVALIGAGTIGASWTAWFLSRGLEVVASDPSPGAPDLIRRMVEGAWPILRTLGATPDADPTRWRFEADPVAAVAGAAAMIAMRPLRAARQAERLARAQRDFHRQREPLEAKFIERAAASGKPRGLRWSDVDFDDDVVYARDRRTGGLKALVAVEVQFEAVEGGGMEHVENVALSKAATAEFLYDGTRWITEGRIYFNLAPTAAVKYLAQDMELVAEPPTAGLTRG